MNRRHFMQGVTGSAALASAGLLAPWARAAGEVPLTYGLPQGDYDTAIMASLPGKKPLIKLAYRPPNYETPASYFDTPITPNDAFFVRYHLAGIPPRIDVKDWTLTVGGAGTTSPVTLTMADLQSSFEPVEFSAVCQCSGNRRGLSDPHVPGVQWSVGAMGNAVWKGTRLKDVLAKAGVTKDAVEVVVNGADGPVLTSTPDFVKSLPLWKATDDNTIIAYQMNGESLPHFNGFPARLIVPGWTATYWMKHIVSIEAITKPFDGFWVKNAYRIPNGAFPIIQRFITQETLVTIPITEMVINSLITAPTENQRFRPGAPVDVRGVAWDGGYGIARVDVSTDGGRSWEEATLGPDSGKYAFRPWTYRFAASGQGKRIVMAKATNHVGQTQVDTLIFNGAGYHNNVVRPTSIVIG